MKLTIVIPALNEEDAIGSTIERCLAAREVIVQRSPVDDVEIIVVSDGSTDRTVEIASTYDEIKLIVFPVNRGYGAAIKQGFETGTGNLVGFLDADGTCDPNVFAVLCETLVAQGSSVAIGTRMGPDSKMPFVRRVGNRVYALILSALSNQVVTDTASGMRVIDRQVLDRLYPLPDGLNFTPAMSARVLMDEQLSLAECPMPYEDRVGESKLHVVQDGIRFLRTILEMSLMWRPAKLFVAAASVCLVVMIALGVHPLEMWVRQGHLQEDMIYRLLFCSFLGTVAVAMISAAVISTNLIPLVAQRRRKPTFLMAMLDGVYTFRGCAVVSILSLPVVGWLIGPGLWTYLTGGYVEVHWSRVVLAGLITFGVIQLFVNVLVANLIRFHVARQSMLPGKQGVQLLADSSQPVRIAKRPGEPNGANEHRRSAC